MAERKWMGSVDACDICRCDLKLEPYFVDGKTKMGPWALMCPADFKAHGVGLGTGRGQKYRTSDLVKIEG